MIRYNDCGRFDILKFEEFITYLSRDISLVRQINAENGQI